MKGIINFGKKQTHFEKYVYERGQYIGDDIKPLRRNDSLNRRGKSKMEEEKGGNQ